MHGTAGAQSRGNLALEAGTGGAKRAGAVLGIIVCLALWLMVTMGTQVADDTTPPAQRYEALRQAGTTHRIHKSGVRNDAEQPRNGSAAQDQTPLSALPSSAHMFAARGCVTLPFGGTPRTPDVDPWKDIADPNNAVQVKTLGMRLWCTEKPEAHVCRARHLCYLKGSVTGLQDGWYLPYHAGEMDLIWTPHFKGRAIEDPMGVPVLEDLAQPWGAGSPALGTVVTPAYAVPIFRFRTSEPRIAASCLPNVTKSMTIPGTTWLFDWGRHPSTAHRSFWQQYAAMSVARSDAAFVPRRIDSVASLSLPSTHVSAMHASALQALGFARGNVRYRSELEAWPPNSAVCFDTVVAAFEKNFFSKPGACGTLRDSLAPPHSKCTMPTKVVYLRGYSGVGAAPVVVNEAQVLAALQEAVVSDVIVQELDLSKDVSDVAAQLSDAAILVTPHGAHVADLLLMHKHAALVELLPWKYFVDTSAALAGCDVAVFPVRTNSVAEAALPESLVQPFYNVQELCAKLSDKHCTAKGVETAALLAKLPMMVDVPKFSSVLVKAMDSVKQARKLC